MTGKSWNAVFRNLSEYLPHLERVSLLCRSVCRNTETDCIHWNHLQKKMQKEVLDQIHSWQKNV